MTLSTLVIDRLKQNAQARKTAATYLAVSILCVIFDRVYALFGHGVYSASMTLMFLYPLAGGMLPFLIQGLFVDHAARVDQNRIFYNSYNSGLATLTTGSLLNGIFEIAGTESSYLAVFTAAGWAMLTAGLLGYSFNLLRRSLKNVRIEFRV